MQLVKEIKIDTAFLESYAKQYLDNFYQQYFSPVWLTRADIKRITGVKTDEWVRLHIDNDPTVIENGWKFDISEEGSSKSQPRYSVEIREFLKKFGKVASQS